MQGSMNTHKKQNKFGQTGDQVCKRKNTNWKEINVETQILGALRDVTM